MSGRGRDRGGDTRREFLGRITAVGAAGLVGGLGAAIAGCARPIRGAEVDERVVPEGGELLFEPIALRDGDVLADRVLVVSRRFRNAGDALVHVTGSRVRIRNVRIVGADVWDPHWNDWDRRLASRPGLFGRTAGIRIEKARDVSVEEVRIEGLPGSGIVGSAIDGGVFRDLGIRHCFHGLQLPAPPPDPNRRIHVEALHVRDLWGPGPGTWPGLRGHGVMPSRVRPGGFIGGDALILNTLRDALVTDCTATGEMYGAFKMTNPQKLEVRRLRGVNIMIMGTAGSKDRQWAIHPTPARDIRIHDSVFDKGDGYGECALAANCVQVSQNVRDLRIEACTLAGGGRDGHAIQLHGDSHARVVGCTIRGFNGRRGPNPAHAVDIGPGCTINADFERVNTFVDQRRIRLDRSPHPRGASGD